MNLVYDELDFLWEEMTKLEEELKIEFEDLRKGKRVQEFLCLLI